MCGIVGITSSFSQTEREWLVSGRDAMIHRGPDDFGEWWSVDGRVGFAHRRLAIVDLSSAGHQPMLSGSGALAIVFNGEIYNFIQLRNELIQKGYSFKSHSDTEVILAAYEEWDHDCVKRFNGMFSFAIYDLKKQRVFLARDRSGEKPLFYYHQGNTLRFASELKALLADTSLKRQISPRAFDCYLAMGYVPGSLCMLEGFSKLPPAHALEFDLNTGRAKTWCYWHPPKFELVSESVNEEFLLNKLENLLGAAVQRQMLADVPVGVLLSGGVDSSLITAMASRTSNHVDTFTIGFPGHGKLDETEHARLISGYFGTRHTELMAGDITVDLFKSLARQFDEPIADSSMIPTFLVSQLVKKQCSAVMGGDGGDELFGGYEHYKHMQKMKLRSRLVPLSIRKMFSSIAEKNLPVGFKGRHWLQNFGINYKEGAVAIPPYFDVTSRRGLRFNDLKSPSMAEIIFQSQALEGSDLLQRSTRMDFSNYLAEDILVKVDRASMLNSLEVRAPFLDCDLVEFAFAKVPSHLKATSGDKKILLKRLAERVLPPNFDRQRKQGFSIPLSEILKGDSFRSFFYQVLLDPSCAFNASSVSKLLDGQARGRSNSERLFSLVFFELWRREYGVAF